VRCPKIWCWSSFTPPVSSVIKKSFEVIVIRAESGRRALYYFLSRFCRVLLTGVFVALRPKLAVRNFFFSARRREDAREMKCVRGSERKHTRQFSTVSERVAATVERALENRKTRLKPIRLSSASGSGRFHDSAN
jgi:hypothetical protein